MNSYEKKYQEQGYIHVIGLDEAGRGPMAGPLVVAGVCFPQGYQNEVIYDSKQLSEKKRLAMFDIIKKDALFCEIDIVDMDMIDEVNIYQATKQTMESIVRRNDVIHVALSDALPFMIDGVIVESIIKGDQKSVSIAAASILAKVTRDQLMQEYDKQYPEYGFGKHKGYGTKMHKEAIMKHGRCAIHRKTFRFKDEV